MPKVIVGNLTVGEVVQVLGRAIEDVGNNMDEGKYDDGVQIGEIVELVQSIAADLYGQYQDDDSGGEG